ncbi:uncharacterized protein ARMOST_20635 [Armillaria ostoyae]|uniref:Uncharacterized protein n=1 Tax=Armillaria ostoyae TaxID=47428 RepID=A0A284S7X9_ARMOS|nr:uncharacterized protein ARMOST_20635 [Armillaria ostoyae]
MASSRRLGSLTGKVNKRNVAIPKMKLRASISIFFHIDDEEQTVTSQGTKPLPTGRSSMLFGRRRLHPPKKSASVPVGPIFGIGPSGGHMIMNRKKRDMIKQTFVTYFDSKSSESQSSAEAILRMMIAWGIATVCLALILLLISAALAVYWKGEPAFMNEMPFISQALPRERNRSRLIVLECFLYSYG